MASSSSPVRATGVDDTDRRGGWTPDVDTRMARLEAAVRDVLAPALESDTRSAALNADRIAIVPDAHYPFHPSTGMVTDPAVVGALVAHLEERTDADIAVVGATDEYIDFDRTAQYLGYPALLERFDADLVDLADEAGTEDVYEIDDQSILLSVPERFAESTVVTVPTLRPTETGAIAGGMRRLGSLVDRPGETGAVTGISAAAATRAVEPAVSVMDATIAYGGDPYASNALFAGTTPAVDAIGTSLLGRSIEEDDALRRTVGTDDAPVALERVGPGDDDLDISAIRQQLSGGELPPSDATHPAVTAAYRLYATVGGDAVPPQLEQ